jgi:hypothetical protein
MRDAVLKKFSRRPVPDMIIRAPRKAASAAAPYAPISYSWSMSLPV